MLYSMLIFIILIVLVEGYQAVKNKTWKELALIIGITLVAVLYGCNYYYCWEFMPNPNYLLHKLQPAAKSLEIFFTF